MAHTGPIRVLICCHYYGGGSSVLEQQGLLTEALRSRGYTGTIDSVERRFQVSISASAIAAIASEQLRKEGWRTAIDNFKADLGSFGFSIFVYGSDPPAYREAPRADDLRAEPAAKGSDLFGVARRLAQAGRLQDAVDAFGAVPPTDPGHATAVFNRAVLVAQLGYPSDALALLESIKDPDHSVMEECRRAAAAGDQGAPCKRVPLRG